MGLQPSHEEWVFQWQLPLFLFVNIYIRNMLYIKSKRDEVDVIECNWQLSNYETAIRDDTYDHNSSIPFLEI